MRNYKCKKCAFHELCKNTQLSSYCEDDSIGDLSDAMDIIRKHTTICDYSDGVHPPFIILSGGAITEDEAIQLSKFIKVK